MSAPVHTLTIAAGPDGLTYTVECPGPHRDCSEYQPCTDPVCAVLRDQDHDDDAYYEALEKTDGVMHDVEHRLIEAGNDEEWMVPSDRCYYAGEIVAEQVQTGSKTHAGGAHLPPGSYPVQCSGPEEYEMDAKSTFYIVDHPASIFTSAAKAREAADV